MDTKVCTKCGVEYPATTEWFHSHGGLSLRSVCKSCCLEQCRFYREQNKEKVAEHDRLYREQNKEKRAEHYRLYYEQNPEVRRVGRHRRRARKIGNGGSHTAADIRLIKVNQSGKCWWCGKKVKDNNWHVEHRVPFARGGSNAAENIVLSCPTCNLRKHAKLPQEFCGRLF